MHKAIPIEKGQPLSPREKDVMMCLLTGKRNKAIGKILCISEKTVAKHFQWIYKKLGVNSRVMAILTYNKKRGSEQEGR
jgi:DNA-binding CsgD family transcriptional regulator